MKRNVPKDSQGLDIVKISKSKYTLGLVFEGGINTDQKIPLIINVTADGAAAENWTLRVGQLIRELDGRNVEGNVFLNHSDFGSMFLYKTSDQIILIVKVVEVRMVVGLTVSVLFLVSLIFAFSIIRCFLQPL
jgi:hypothetical protein